MRRNDSFPYHLGNSAIIIDIRTPSEIIDFGKIPNSYHNNFSNDISLFTANLDKIIKSKDIPFYLICQTGSRSNLMMTQLLSEGYDCFNILGGIVGVIRENKITLIKNTLS